MPQYDVFIAHPSEHKDAARAIAAALRERGLCPFVDEQLDPGADWMETLLRIQEGCRASVVLWTKDLVARPYLRDEVRTALERNARYGHLVFPVWIGPPGARLPYGLDAFQAAADVDRVVEEVCRQLGDPGHAREQEITRLEAALEGLRGEGASTIEVAARLRALRRERRLEDVPTRLGKWEILEPIGKGGFSTVYLARPIGGVRTQRVAIKVLHADRASHPDSLSRFCSGSIHMNELDHPGIVKVIDWATPEMKREHSHVFFVMEHIDGEDLQRRVPGGLPVEAGIEAVLAVADGLAYAHARGRVHRDVKPANILLGRDGRAKLTGFDLVLAEESTHGTRTGAAPGTMLYAAPEQLYSAGTVDQRADVYSLGMVLAFVLAGKVSPREAMFRREKFLAGLPCSDVLRAMVREATEPESADRTPDMATFARQLRAALDQGHHPAAVSAAAQLQELAFRFCRAAGRDPVAVEAGLRIPEPVLLSPEGEEVEQVGEALDQLLRAPTRPAWVLLAHDAELSGPLKLLIARAAVHGTSLLTLSARQMSASLYDAACAPTLDGLLRRALGQPNLFEATNALRFDWEFFGRAQLLHTIGESLARGEHLYVVGTRKSGKSSLLHFLRLQLTGVPCVHIDLQAYGEEGWTSAFFRDVLLGYDRWGAQRFFDQWRFSEEVAPDRRAFLDGMRARHRRAVSLGVSGRWVLLIDEMERILPRPGDEAGGRAYMEVALALRTLGQGAEPVLSCVIADLRPEANRRNLLEGIGTNPFFEMFRELPLPNLELREVTQMLQELALRMGVKEVDPDLCASLYTATGGHARLTRMVAAAAWSQREDPAAFRLGDLPRGLAWLARRDQPARFFDECFWQMMTDLERAVMIRAASRQPLQAPPEGVSPRAWRVAQAALHDHGLLREGAISLEALHVWILDEVRPGVGEAA
jgi:serine/threonine protein kinase